jgi:hypothetical protein
MTPRRQKSGRIVPSPEPLHVANPHAAGIDLRAEAHWVAVPPVHVPPPKPVALDAGGASNLPPHVRKFSARTADLELLADWLRLCGITSVAMESTGVYWIPLFELLERRGLPRLSGRPPANEACPRPAQERRTRLHRPRILWHTCFTGPSQLFPSGPSRQFPSGHLLVSFQLHFPMKT